MIVAFAVEQVAQFYIKMAGVQKRGASFYSVVKLEN